MLPGIVSATTGAAGGGAFEVSFCGSISWSSGSTITGSVDIGAADSTREIFLVSAVHASVSRTLTAASTTVNAVAVTKATNEFVETYDTTFGIHAMAFATVAAGTGSVTVTATYSGALTGGIVGVYRVVRRAGIGNNQTDADDGINLSGTTVTVNATTINANGLWFGSFIREGTGGTVTPPTGTVEDVEASNGTARITINSRAIQVNSSTPSDVWTASTSATLSAASWAFA